MEGQIQSEVAVVMVPAPAQGHINPLFRLSQLIISYGIPVHFTGSATHNRLAKLRTLNGACDDSSSFGKINFHEFELPTFSKSPSTPHFVFHIATQLRQPVSELVKQLATEFRRVVVIHDNLMASVVQDLEFISNAELFHFSVISAFATFSYRWESLSEKPFQVDENILPTCFPSTDGATVPEIAEFISYQSKFWNAKSKRLYNTSRVIEGPYIELLENLSEQIFAFGPYNTVEMNFSGESRSKDRCLKWLDEQEKCSVVYVAFGSLATLSDEQIKELAVGLERSGHKFIWVVKNADKDDESEVRRPELPEGYENRVQNRGMVIKDWAPQVEILAHPSTGGFMSHCGWNSCLESISMGVPIAAWPLHSEQPRNAVLITEMLRIGVMARHWENRDQVVTSAAIERVVNQLMASKEGEEIRKRAVELGDAVRKSVSQGGVCSSERDAFIAHITR